MAKSKKKTRPYASSKHHRCELIKEKGVDVLWFSSDSGSPCYGIAKIDQGDALVLCRMLDVVYTHGRRRLVQDLVELTVKEHIE